MLLLICMAVALSACGGKETGGTETTAPTNAPETDPPETTGGFTLTAQPSDMLELAECGWAPLHPEFDEWEDGKVSVIYYKDETQTECAVTGIRTPQEFFEEGDSYYRLSLVNAQAADPGDKDHAITPENTEDYQRLSELLEGLDLTETEKPISNYCSSDFGLSLLACNGGETTQYFFHMDGYAFREVESEDGVSRSVAVIEPEVFSTVLGLEMAYSDDSYGREMEWFAGSEEAEPSEYCLCLSTAEYHLDLSLPQAAELLSGIFKDGKIPTKGSTVNTGSAVIEDDYIYIVEYTPNMNAAYLYLRPDGKLVNIRPYSLYSYDPYTYMWANGSYIIESEEAFDYQAVLGLMRQLGEKTS